MNDIQSRLLGQLSVIVDGYLSSNDAVLANVACLANALLSVCKSDQIDIVLAIKSLFLVSWTAVHREDVGVDFQICLNREINLCYHGDA